MHSYLLYSCGMRKRGYGRNSTYFAILLFVQSEAECKDGNNLKFGGSTSKGGLVGRSDKGVMDQVKDLRTWSSQHSSIEASDCFSATPVHSFLCQCIFTAY